jgi:hypothetical protein
VTRRLLLGYLGVTLFVLVSLEVPLGLQNERTARRDLTANVSHDAMVVSADAEDAVQRPTARQLDALAAIAAEYTNRTGGRIVIVKKDGSALVDTSRIHFPRWTRGSRATGSSSASSAAWSSSVRRSWGSARRGS